MRTSIQAVISHLHVLVAASEAGELSGTRALIARNEMILLAKRREKTSLHGLSLHFLSRLKDGLRPLTDLQSRPQLLVNRMGRTAL